MTNTTTAPGKMTALARFEALQGINARRKASWYAQPEAQVGIVRKAMNRAYRVAQLRGLTNRFGVVVGTPCSCGCGKPVPSDAEMDARNEAWKTGLLVREAV